MEADAAGREPHPWQQVTCGVALIVRLSGCRRHTRGLRPLEWPLAASPPRVVLNRSDKSPQLRDTTSAAHQPQLKTSVPRLRLHALARSTDFPSSPPTPREQMASGVECVIFADYFSCADWPAADIGARDSLRLPYRRFQGRTMRTTSLLMRAAIAGGCVVVFGLCGCCMCHRCRPVADVELAAEVAPLPGAPESPRFHPVPTRPVFQPEGQDIRVPRSSPLPIELGGREGPIRREQVQVLEGSPGPTSKPIRRETNQGSGSADLRPVEPPSLTAIPDDGWRPRGMANDENLANRPSR
jgi:hypothetical protein